MYVNPFWFGFGVGAFVGVIITFSALGIYGRHLGGK